MPSAVVEETEETVGTTPSITRALLAPNELLESGLARVKIALFPAPSRMVPLFNAKELGAL